jgi:hypothetical protein
LGLAFFNCELILSGIRIRNCLHYHERLKNAGKNTTTWITLALCVIGMLPLLPTASCAAVQYGVRDLFVFQSENGSGGQGAVKLPISYGERDGVAMKFDIDPQGNIYLNVTMNRHVGWEPLSAEEAYRDMVSPTNHSSDDVQAWVKKTGYKPYVPPDDEAWRMYVHHIEVSTSPTPSFVPRYDWEEWTFVISPDGKVLSKQKGIVHPTTSGLMPRESVTFEKDTWLNSLPLDEYRNQTQQITTRIGNRTEIRTIRAVIRSGWVLGIDSNGNTAFLADVSLPYTRKHVHGTGDRAFKIYFLSPKKEILFAGQSYDAAWMESRTHLVYEMYTGPYEGLAHALDEPTRPRVLTLRIWGPK